ncbi:MAG TPA: aldehyde dehydrogenase family protein, partial [Actinopolymorphaceae bacterium]
MATDTTRGREAGEPGTPGSAREGGEAATGSVAARVGTERIARLLRRVRATSGETFPVYAPVTGERLAEMPSSGADDVAEAFARAREAQRSWERVPVAERARLLLRLHDQ